MDGQNSIKWSAASNPLKLTSTTYWSPSFELWESVRPEEADGDDVGQ